MAEYDFKSCLPEKLITKRRTLYGRQACFDYYFACLSVRDIGVGYPAELLFRFT